MPTAAAQPPDEFEQALISVFREAMAARDVSGAELARRTGISEPQVSLLFSGRRSLRFGQFVAICHALGLSPSTITTIAEGRVDES